MTAGGISTRRLEAFSDAVLAVAITLMVLRIGTPTPAPGESMGHAFVNVTLPAIIYFLITFAVIVIFLVFLYLTGLTVLIGGETSAELHDRSLADRTPDPVAPAFP